MACRPESETILNREQLAEFTHQLQRLSDDGVEKIYQTVYRDCRFDTVYRDCRFDEKKLPPPWRSNSWWRAGGCCGSADPLKYRSFQTTEKLTIAPFLLC